MFYTHGVPLATSQFSVSATTRVSLKIFNAVGEEVATLADGVREAGVHTAVWSAEKMASGVYYYKLQAGNLIQTKR